MLGLQVAGITMMLIAAIPMITANKARAIKN